MNMIRKSKLFVALTGIVAGSVTWPVAQSVIQPNKTLVTARVSGKAPLPAKKYEPPMTREGAVDQATILEPAAMEIEVKKRQTREELEREQIATFAVSQPKAYAATIDRFKDAERRQKEKAARDAVLDPIKHSGSVEALREDAQQKKDRKEPLDEILDPKFISRAVPTMAARKTPVKVKD